MASPRVMLADDHAILFEAFRKLLEPQYEVVGTVVDGRALVESAPQLKPDASALLRNFHSLLAGGDPPACFCAPARSWL